MIYLNRKPYVIRTSNKPFENIKSFQGINTTRLEQMEDRLKADILVEKAKYEGLVLVHEEHRQGQILPVWMALEHIQTSREVFEDLEREKFHVKYVRIPISPEQAPDDLYIDEYFRAIRATKLSDSFIVNCGMGVGRTTFVMVMAVLIRGAYSRNHLSTTIPIEKQIFREAKFKKGSDSQFFSINQPSHQILRLVCLLDKALPHGVGTKSVAEWALSKPTLIDDLESAMNGNYYCVSLLVGTLTDGLEAKEALDAAIAKCFQRLM